ncbi:MAG: beta-ketoacyl synthase N-terminal-like domain-containing protein, partial [bacterium]
MRRAVITGVGVICAIARNAGQYWDSLSAGVCGIRDITLFDASSHRVKIAAQVPDAYFDQPLERPARRLSRNDRLGLIALEEALRTSGLEHGSLQPERISVVIGSGSGGLLSAEMFKKAALSGET